MLPCDFFILLEQNNNQVGNSRNLLMQKLKITLICRQNILHQAEI